VAVLQIAISIGTLDLEVPVVAVKFVTGSDINIVTIEGDSSQAPVCAAAFKIDVAGIPVDVLFTGLFVEINGVYAAVAFTLLAAADDGSRDELGEL